MPLNVINPNERDSQGQTDHFCGGNAYKQGSHQARSVLNSDSAQVRWANVRFVQCLSYDGNNLGKVGASRNFGNHSAKSCVEPIL